ncbi:MAG: MATE family efflux transporter [Actinomycetota bacterium]
MIARRSPWDREIARLAVPAVGALVAEPLYLLTDTAIVGRIGTAELGGLAVANAVLLTAYALSIFLAYGTTAAVARRAGGGDLAGAAHHGVQALWFGLALGTALACVGAVVAEPLVDAIGAEEEVRPFALTYLRISLLSLPAVLAVLAGTGYLRGLQDARLPLIVAVSTALLNLVVELILVFPLELGVAGSAWSTVLATWVAAAVYVRVAARSARAHGATIRPDLRTLRDHAGAGAHLVVRTAALRAAFLLATVIAARMGTTELAAHEIGFQVWVLLALGLDALAVAGQSVVGYRLGADDVAGARAVARRLVELGLAGGMVVGAVVVLVRAPVAGIFSTDDEVVRLTAFVLLIVGAMQVVNGVVFVLDGVLIGAGDLPYLGRAMAISAAAFAPLAVAVGATGAGIGWLWASLAVFLLVRAATLAWRWRGEAWLVPGAPVRG